MIISVHIPKTAGATLRASLSQAFGDRAYFDYVNNVTDPQPASLRTRAVLAMARLRHPFRPNDIELIHGHFKARKYDHLYPDATKVTFMRDPVERVVSHYRYWLRHPVPTHSVCRRLHDENWTLRDFARHPSSRNTQSVFFDGLDVSDFAFVGLQERFDACLPMFFEAIGMPPMTIPPRNVNEAKDVADRYPLEPELREEIEALNALDRALYDQAVVALEQKMRIAGTPGMGSGAPGLGK